MLYIHHKKGYTEIVFKTYELIIDKSNISVIKEICRNNLFNYDYKIKYTKEILNIKTRPPLYINENILLIPCKSLRNYHNVWINYFNILEVVKNGSKTKIIFNNLSELLLDIGYHSFLKSINDAKRIINYVNEVIKYYEFMKMS
ncbi:MAG: competence protein ComK [Acholeplasmatales bacterium]